MPPNQSKRNPPASRTVRRQRNARGKGDRLRVEILDTATALLAESGDASQLSLRSVARQIGIATTSVYLHFPDIEHITAAVAERSFADLGRAIARASRAGEDPLDVLLAGCRAYCRFALQHPGQYRVLFDVARPDLAPTMVYGLEQSPGQRVLLELVAGVERSQQTGVADPKADPQRLAILLWAALHGIASLRLSRSRFPWPPLNDTVDEAVRRLLGPAVT